MTPAAWIRNFVREHPDYKHDSVVSPKTAADLMAKCHKVGLGLERAPELHGSFPIAPIDVKDAYAAPLVSDVPLTKSETLLSNLVDHYAERTELGSTKRKLQTQIADLSSQLERRQAELRAVEAQMEALKKRSPG